MKFKKFLDWIYTLIINIPDIDLKTVKLIMNQFTTFLSNTEYNKYKNQVLTINAITTKQISFDTLIKNNKINELNKKLRGIKSGNNKPI